MIFKSAFVTSGMGLVVLLKVLFAHGVSLAPLTVLRLMTVSVVGMATSVMAALTASYRLIVVRRRPVRTDPIFIVGHWRTGSTYLHELMTLDDRLSAPTTLQCTAPTAYPLSMLLIAPVMLLSSRKRPMDNVRIGAASPQEDEFALLRLTGFSPLLKLAFPPSDGRYFLRSDEAYLPDDEGTAARFEAALTYILKTAQGMRGRRPVLKNPCHTLRIDWLRERFPNASFVHIRRNPADVIPSTRRMWSILGPKNTLRGAWRDPSLEEIISVYNRLERVAEESLATVPSAQKVDVSFEDLERDPAAVLSAIYDRFGMPVTDALRQKWERKRTASLRYKKNRYALSPAEEALIRSSAAGS